jgi:hypothetical protein
MGHGTFEEDRRFSLARTRRALPPRSRRPPYLEKAGKKIPASDKTLIRIGLQRLYGRRFRGK